MLGNKDAIANLAVSDLERAKRFYEDVLGLSPDGGQDGEVAAYRSGASRVWVYRSEFAGANKATAASWQVDDIRAVVDALKSKGVTFERYDMPGLRHEDGVHVAEDGSMSVAWFKDPDGNILSLVSD